MGSTNTWICICVGVAIALLGSFVRAQTPEQAIAFERQGNFAEATEVWKAVVQRNPQDAAAFAQLGVTLSKQQRYQEAASAYRRALALDPQLPGIELNLGLAEFKQAHFRAGV